MAKLQWDKVSERFYETGVKHGVLYPQANDGTYPKGVAWNGLTAVTESPSGADSNPLYADDIKYLDLRSAEDFGITIEAYYYPDEFAICDGTAEPTAGVKIGQQTRTPFGLCYETILGNDVNNNDYGRKLHLVYNATAAPSEKNYQTVNESPEAISFSWEATTTPVSVTGYKPTACIIIDSTKVDAAKLKDLEDILFGTEDADPRLPLPDEIISTLRPTPSVTTVDAYPIDGAEQLSAGWLAAESGSSTPLTPVSENTQYQLMEADDPYSQGDLFTWSGTAYVPV